MSVNQGVSVQPSQVKDTGFSECVCFEILYSGSMYDSEIADWLLFLSFLFFYIYVLLLNAELVNFSQKL